MKRKRLKMSMLTVNTFNCAKTSQTQHTLRTLPLQQFNCPRFVYERTGSRQYQRTVLCVTVGEGWQGLTNGG